MTLFDEMRHAMPSLTKSEAKAASAILDNPSVVLNGGITTVAKSLGVSNSALIRMCQKLGFNGYAEFKFSLHRTLLASESVADGAHVEEDTGQLLSVYSEYIRRIPRYVSDEQLERFAQSIISARRLDIWGRNRTSESAQQLSHRLTRLGVYNKWTDDPTVMEDDADIFGVGDVCVVFTLSGRGSSQYSAFMKTLRDRGAEVFLVSMNKQLPLCENATEAFFLPWISRDNSANFFEDQIIVMMFIEILLLKVSRLLT